jgi:thiosulfate/3-mercaptopyruvate sulfurtransferase
MDKIGMFNLENLPLVETDWLAGKLDSPVLAVIDARWRGDGSATGLELYQAGHIPGAVHLDWELDLAWTDPAGLRYMLRPPAQFEALMARSGIGNENRVIIYSDYDYSGATRLWWALHYYGHRQVAVLNGGWNKWLAEGRAVTTQTAPPAPGKIFTCEVQPGWLATAAEIYAGLESERVRLVDTRPPEQYAGKAVWTPPGSRYLAGGADRVEIGARQPMRAGHIPGAVNITSSTNLNPADWTYLPVPSLRQKAIEAGLEPSQRIITYCGVGISASLGLFSLYLAGFRNLGLYDASWEEWGTDPALPIEKPG